MRTIRSLPVLIASLVALDVAAQEPAGPGPARARGPTLVVPDGPAPTVDGRIDEEEWKGAEGFSLLRGEEAFASGRIRRQGRQLYLALETELSPWAMGLRLSFSDPVAKSSIIVLVTPLHTPRTPLSAFRSLEGREAEPLSCSACDVRFAFAEGPGFSCELRLPLDVLEFAGTDKVYEFAAEMWGLETNRAIAVYPHASQGGLATVGVGYVDPGGKWSGAGEAVPPRNEALALLEELAAVDPETGPPLFANAGWLGGRRCDAPLAELQERLEKAIAAYPDYVSLRTLLAQVRMARNDLAGTLAVVDELGAAFPAVGASPRHLLVRAELLRDLGRYAEAVEHLERNAEALRTNPNLAGDKAILAAMRDHWRIEQEIRKEEAARDDLPRVRMKTTKGEFVIELFEDDAPNGVANFVSLVESGAYEGTRFHWVEGGRRMLGGDPNSRDDDPHNDGFGDPGYMIEAEPGRRLHFPFTVSYADKRRTRATEGSIFAIHVAPFPAVDGRNTVFGRVIEGEDVVRRLEYYDAIEKAEVIRRRDHPYEPVKRP